MIKTIALFLFALWLLGAFGVYSIGWPYHALLIASIMLVFIAAMRNRKPEINEIMINNELSEKDAEQVKRLMEKNRLNEREAVELLNIRSKPDFADSNNLIQIEAGQVNKIMNKNRLNRQEAAKLLSLRLKFHH